MKSVISGLSFVTAVVIAAVSLGLSAAEPVVGPVIMSNGPVILPPEGSYNLNPDEHYKVSINIGDTAEFPGDINRKLVSVARFLNMHAQAGIPKDNIEFAIVVHGKAVSDFLTDESYQARFNDVNPNTTLISELQSAGVDIYLCSQTAAFRNIGFDEFHGGVTIALSAMTSHVRLEQEGYRLIPF
jgi:intracellular sulfur oxidation DsrE/DsrF family protein